MFSSPLVRIARRLSLATAAAAAVALLAPPAQAGNPPGGYSPNVTKGYQIIQAQRRAAAQSSARGTPSYSAPAYTRSSPSGASAVTVLPGSVSPGTLIPGTSTPVVRSAVQPYEVVVVVPPQPAATAVAAAPPVVSSPPVVAAPAAPAAPTYVTIRGPDGQLRRYPVEGGQAAIERPVVTVREGQSTTIYIGGNR